MTYSMVAHARPAGDAALLAMLNGEVPGPEVQPPQTGEWDTPGQHPQSLPLQPTDGTAVALPFHDDTVLLSYADNLALVVTRRGNKLSRTQQELDLISWKCEELGVKILAKIAHAMMVKAVNPAWQLHIQGVGLAWTKSYQYLEVWVDKQLSFMVHVAYLREMTQARLNMMWATTHLTEGATYSVLRLYYVQAIRSLVDYSIPPPAGVTRGAAECCHEDHARGTKVVQHDADPYRLHEPRNKLPSEIKGCARIDIFKKKLKTYLFKEVYDFNGLEIEDNYRC
ncbi:hypothetical protein E2C01_022297 [Portunus trituberculatus]|uniref:Reverse transcriptase domain-containing protein n=1 Tax=Portunus trituberculatus TaxID=210409 RepID=A0A5B7E502_PORTR|nr:hypothetical protein [Portunus trituberculatus]